MVLIDVENLARNPDPIFSTYKRVSDAQHDLMRQAVDGRLRGYTVVELDNFRRGLSPVERMTHAI